MNEKDRTLEIQINRVTKELISILGKKDFLVAQIKSEELKTLISMRSKEQVKRLEKAKGLI